MHSRRILPGFAVGLAALAYCGLAAARGLYPTQFFSTLDGPSAVVSADMNGDGHPDLVELGAASTVAILLNKGNGTFKSPAIYYVGGTGPEMITVGDLNGDGNPDVVTADTTGNTVSVFLGDGKGGLIAQTSSQQAAGKGTPAPTYAVGTQPAAVAIGDVNGDGKPDLVVANVIDNTLSVLLGNGDGTFKAQTTLAVGKRPTWVAIADLNHDGHADLLVSNSGENDFGVLLGTGGGNFKAQAKVHIGPLPSITVSQILVVADFNNDGNLDVVTTLVNPSIDTAQYFGGNGDGTFRSGRTLTTGLQTRFLAAADVNGDGNMDLIAGSANTATIRVMLGNGIGGFSAGTDYPASGINTALISQAFTVDDFNGDGKPDIAAINATGSFLQLLYNDGNGRFHQSGSYDTGTVPSDVASADLNGDHHADVVEINAQDGTLDVRLGNGDGTLQPLQTYTVGSHPVRLQLADVNGDGKLDALTVNNGDNSVSVLLGNGDGTFQAAKHFAAGENPSDLAVADMDGDGNPDVVVADQVVNQVSILHGKGNGSFAAPVSYPAGTEINGLAVNDVTRDGAPDVVVVGGNVGVLRNDGKGALIPIVLDENNKSPYLYSLIGTRVTLRDVNQDGRPDVIVTDYSNSQLGVLLDHGAGFFTRSPLYVRTCSNPSSLQLADLNDDGNLDAVVTCVGGSAVGVLLGNGQGGFVGSAYAAELDPRGATIADFNEDGQPDLAVVNGGSDTLNMMLQITGVVAADKAPVAIDEPFEVTDGATAQSGSLAGHDPNGDALTYSVVSLSKVGAFITYGTTDGSFSYLPPTGVTGADSFQFQVSDGVKLSNVATITVNIETNTAGQHKSSGHGFLGGFYLPLLPLLLGLWRRRRRG